MKISVIVAGPVFENRSFGHHVNVNRSTQNAYLGLLGHHAVESGQSQPHNKAFYPRKFGFHRNTPCYIPESSTFTGVHGVRSQKVWLSSEYRVLYPRMFNLHQSTRRSIQENSTFTGIHGVISQKFDFHWNTRCFIPECLTFTGVQGVLSQKTRLSPEYTVLFFR
jgi:hypothetical protein